MSDQLPHLHKWKNIEAICELYRIYIYPRPGFDKKKESLSNMRIFDVPLMEISSSFIRKSIKEGKDMRFMLAPKVYEMILDANFFH